MGLTTSIISNEDDLKSIQDDYTKGCKIVPIFPMSNVSGNGVELIRKFINELKLYINYEEFYNSNTNFIVSKSYVVQGIGLIISGVLKTGTVKKGDTLYLGPNADGFIRDENNVIIEKSKASNDTTNNNYYKVVVKNIHNNFKENVDCLHAGQSGCFNIKTNAKIVIKRKMIKKGMRLLSIINSVREFDAKIKILHNPSTITKKYQPTINCEGISQSVQIVEMDKDYLRSFDEANVRFKFMYKPEFIECGSLFLFREGLTKGVGKIINVY